MAIKIPVDLVDLILLGPTDDRRQLQDSPILGDVWIEYAKWPGRAQDLLITPHKRATASQVANALAQQFRGTETPITDGAPTGPSERARKQIAYLQGLVAARLDLDDLLLVLAPMTQWWSERKIRTLLPEHYGPRPLREILDGLFRSLKNKAIDYDDEGDDLPEEAPYAKKESLGSADRFTSLDRYLALAGLLVWARDKKVEAPGSTPKTPRKILEMAIDDVDAIVEALIRRYAALIERWKTESTAANEPLIFSVSLNRAVSPALERSVPAVKGDAARSLFKVDARKIAWAVIDSGIDYEHRAFRELDGEGKEVVRIRKVMDFTRIRQLLCIDGDVPALIKGVDISEQDAVKIVSKLRDDASESRPIDWDSAARLITLRTQDGPPPGPVSSHGTHVAGIIGAKSTNAKIADAKHPDAKSADGMCPDIQLYDFRVLGHDIKDTEFAVIAALQYIRWVNDRHSYVTIHGANLSLSIPHNVRNYACGRTPVCNECQRLVESGVVVVAAAGNRGYQRFETKDGPFENYAAFSITDPGNADDVITVGATHGNWPHTYGVSFFSSRGPTGDGRVKPDLVAPGERIYSTIPDNTHAAYGPESGTSMAAPHVSGAAAMLMARYPELIGNPRRIKQILCDSATDLGRERSFQGHGMLDVLRAFQSI